jgi:hypothetical protein
MTDRKTKRVALSGEELCLRLLQSVREMKAREFARVTDLEVSLACKLGKTPLFYPGESR